MSWDMHRPLVSTTPEEDFEYPLRSYTPLRRKPLASETQKTFSQRPYEPLGPTPEYQHIDVKASQYVPKSPTPEHAWQTGFFKHVPWLGISSLALVVCSTTAGAIVLIKSNGDAVDNWKVSPSVVLAILSAVITICLKYSLTSGLNISWWYHMLNGASLADAHRYWTYGNKLLPALTAGRHFNLLSAASILVTLAAIEGPLIQKASTIASRQVSRTMPMTAAVAVNLPSGYTASITGEYRTPTTPTAAFSQAVNEYNTRAQMTSGIGGCPGVCTTLVPGVGFKVSCSPSTNSTWDLDDYSGGVEKQQFSASTTWSTLGEGVSLGSENGSTELLTMRTGWATNTGSPYVYTHRVCNLSLALVSYPISVTGDTVTMTLADGKNPEVLADLPAAQTTGAADVIAATTLGGFDLLGNQESGPFYSNTSMVANGALALFALYGLNSFAWSHAVDPNWDVMNFTAYVWRDPTDDILAAYHDIMFRLAVKAAKNATLVAPTVLNGVNYSSVRELNGTYTYSETYYVSNYEYFGLAMGTILLAVCSVASTFRGWWKIGRPTTLSPLETAKAFEAPLLSECGKNDTVDELMQTVQNKSVKYEQGKFVEIHRGDNSS